MAEEQFFPTTPQQTINISPLLTFISGFTQEPLEPEVEDDKFNDLEYWMTKFIVKVIPPPQIQAEETRLQATVFEQHKNEQTVVVQPVKPVQEETPVSKQSPIEPQTPITHLFTTLTPISPADRALALSIKMVQQRKKQQTKQIQLLNQLRASRIVTNPERSQYGDIAKSIEEQQRYTLGHRYLREETIRNVEMERSRKRNNYSVVLPKITLEEQRKTIRKEGELLSKFKIMNLKYEARKIATELVTMMIGKSVEIYHRKSQYFKKGAPKKISDMLGQSLVRSRVSKQRKGSFTLSRVLQMVVGNDEEQGQEKKLEEKQEQDQDDSEKQQGQGDTPQKQAQQQAQQEDQQSSSYPSILSSQEQNPQKENDKPVKEKSQQQQQDDSDQSSQEQEETAAKQSLQ